MVCVVRYQHSPWGWDYMGQQLTTDLEPVLFVEIVIGPDRCELKNLIKRRVGSGCFSIVEYKGHWVFLCSARRTADGFPGFVSWRLKNAFEAGITLLR